MNNHINARLMAASEINESGEILGQAFFDDPIFSYCMPDENQRRRVLPWLFARLSALGVINGDVFTTTPLISGSAIWLRPGRSDVSLVRLVQAGLIRAPFMLGLKPLGRVLNVMSSLANMHHQKMSKPHWYLFLLGVTPKKQGQGIGGALMKPILQKADSANMSCYLETAQEHNVPYYEKFGFSMVANGKISHGGPRFWAMQRGVN